MTGTVLNYDWQKNRLVAVATGVEFDAFAAQPKAPQGLTISPESSEGGFHWLTILLSVWLKQPVEDPKALYLWGIFVPDEADLGAAMLVFRAERGNKNTALILPTDRPCRFYADLAGSLDGGVMADEAERWESNGQYSWFWFADSFGEPCHLRENSHPAGFWYVLNERDQIVALMVPADVSMEDVQLGIQDEPGLAGRNIVLVG